MAQSAAKDQKSQKEPPPPPPRPVLIAPAPIVDKWGLREIAADAFSVNVPSDIKGGKDEANPGGIPYRTYIAMGQESDFFMISVVNTGEKQMVFQVSKALEGAAGVIKKTGGKIVSEKVITFLGCPGREALVQSPKKTYGLLRVIGSLKRGFSLLYLTDKPGDIDSARALRFLDSFKFDTTGCKESTGEPGSIPDPGRTVNGVYTNEYFGLKLKLPVGWPVQDNYIRESILDSGRKASKSKNEEVNAIVEAAAETTQNLLTVFKHSVGTSPDFNSSFIFGVERIIDTVLDAKAYALSSKRLLLTTRPGLEFPRDVYTENLEGVKFAVIEVQSKRGDLQLKQKYYSAIMKGYALFFLLTYSNDEDLLKLEQIVRSARFEK